MAQDYELLLEWVSERGAGTWEQFREAWDFLQRGREVLDPAERAWKAAAALSSLAHIEISWSEGQWSAAPPVLTMLPRSGGRALLTGARTRALFECPGTPGEYPGGKLPTVCGELDLWPDALERPGAPSCVMVACSSSTKIKELADRCEIFFNYSVSGQLAEMLPPLAATRRSWSQGGIPEGFEVERYDVARLAWDPVEIDAVRGQTGLYRSKTWAQHVHVLTYGDDKSFRVPLSFGIYERLRWAEKKVITYDAVKHELWVPSWARLPLQHERAAVLCSGQLPSHRRSKDGVPGHFYVNVSAGVANRIMQSLQQD